MGFKLGKNKVQKDIIVKTKEELINIINKRIIDDKGNLDLTDINVSKLSDFSNLFKNHPDVYEIDLTGWDVSNIENMAKMFSNCTYLKTIKGLEDWDTSSLKKCVFMFCDCINLIDVGHIENWNMENVENVNGMFDGCKRLRLDLTSWHIRKKSNHFNFSSQALNIKY